MNHARERARAIQRALWTTHNFDSANVIRSQICEIKCALQTLIDRNAVEQYLRVLAAQSAREHGGQLPGGASLNNRQPRNFAQGVTDTLDLF